MGRTMTDLLPTKPGGQGIGELRERAAAVRLLMAIVVAGILVSSPGPEPSERWAHDTEPTGRRTRMLYGYRIAAIAAVALLTITVASCTSREKPDGTSTGSAYIQTPDGSYVPGPAEIAGYTAGPASSTPPAPEPSSPAPSRTNSAPAPTPAPGR